MTAEQVQKIIMESYQKGGVDTIDSVIEVLNIISKVGNSEAITIPQVIKVLEEAKVVIQKKR